MAKALLLVDFQRDFLSRDGRMPVARNQIDGLITAANKAIATARVSSDVIVAIGNEFPRSSFVMNLFRRNAAIAGSRGTQWDERVPLAEAKYFPKWRGDAFCNPELEPFLRRCNVDDLTLTGLYASGCVAATAKAAVARGFHVNVLADAVADSSDWMRAIALRRLARNDVKIIRVSDMEAEAHV